MTADTSQSNQDQPDKSRRSFLKLGLAGAGAAALAAGGVTIAKRMEGIPYDGIENLRPESKAAVEAFLFKQKVIKI